MTLPKRRTSRQSLEARQAIYDENLSQLIVRLDKDLRQQFKLISEFKRVSMNFLINEFIDKYVNKHYPKVSKGVDKLEKKAIRRNR
jgi:predicted HicB family RNase H-like nuclease